MTSKSQLIQIQNILVAHQLPLIWVSPAAQQPPLEYHHEYTMYSILVTSNHNWYLQIPNVSVTHQLPLPWIPLYTPYSIDRSVFLKIKTIGLIYKNKNEKDLDQPLCHCPGSRLHLQDTFQLCPWPIFLKPNHWFPYKNIQTYSSQDSNFTTGFAIPSATV